MNNIAIDHNQPHHVLLVFRANADAQTNGSILKERSAYYQDLKEKGKIMLSGNFWSLSEAFAIVRVTCAAELEEIIDNDPALNQNIFELKRVMAFTPEHDAITFSQADPYQLDQYA